MIKFCPSCKQEKLTTDFAPRRTLRNGKLHYADGLYYQCRGCEKLFRRLNRFKLSATQLKTMLAEQQFACSICDTPFADTEFVIDHDHKCCSGFSTCGKCIRGLLCVRCNNGLGMFQDNPGLLKRAMQYVAH